MEFTQEEKLRINDSKNQVQSAADSLRRVDPRKIPNFDEIENCLEMADKSLRAALRSRAVDTKDRRS